jgi:cystathionine beta-lyase
VTLKPETALLHTAHGDVQNFEAVQPGTFRASSVFFPSMQAWRERDWTAKSGYIYGPHGTPTTFALEAKVAQLEGADHCLVCPSGLNAIALVYITLLRPGDELLVPINVYTANRTFVTQELMGWGINVSIYDPTDLNSLTFTDRTRLVWVEAPCSMTFEYPDLPALVELAHRHGALVALDNAWGAGIAFSPFDFDVDISVHALTKYASGSADVVMGAITTKDKSLYDALKLCYMRLGLNVSGPDAESVLKGLATLTLRYHAHDQSARTLAAHLRNSAKVARVMHPALEDSVGHQFWSRDCRAAAGIFSVVFDGRFSEADIDRFVDSLRLFRIGFSWGGPVSLAVSYGKSVATLQELEGELVRFSVGLEATSDLIADIDQALARL